MPLLQVRDVPADLYETLSKVAENEHRSIAQQTIVLLRSALNMKDKRISRRKAVLQEIENLEIKDADHFPDPSQLVREDRNR